MEDTIPFEITAYLSKWYDVVTAEGKRVIIGGINTSEANEGHQVIGWLEVNGGFEVYAWNCQGILYGWDTGFVYPQNLRLKHKSINSIIKN